MKIREIVQQMFPTGLSRVLTIVALGVLFGIGGYLVYMSRVWGYVGNDPATCINCHVMESYYATWSHSSHAVHTTCNDCHVPHDNLISKYYFKATDGLRHSYVFTMRGEPQSIKAIPASLRVIYDNCVRCHGPMNQDMVKTGLLKGKEITDGSHTACWDCHTEVPHGGSNSLSTTPNALVPFPDSPVPDWIKKATK